MHIRSAVHERGTESFAPILGHFIIQVLPFKKNLRNDTY